jgi:hypothetical protein
LTELLVKIQQGSEIVNHDISPYPAIALDPLIRYDYSGVIWK